MVEYQIVMATDIDEIACDVKQLIEEGWEPQGGVSIACFSEEYGSISCVKTRYAQAMILRT